MHTGKKIPLLVIYCTCLLAACGKIVITGRSTGEKNRDDVEETVRLSVTRGDQVDARRMHFFDGSISANVFRRPAAQLKIAVSGNPNQLGESYHYLQIITEEARFTAGTSHAKNFIENNFGQLLYMHASQQDADVQAASGVTSHFGNGWLAIIQDNDRRVRWTIAPGSDNCLAVGNGCFDMQTFTRTIFNELVDGVEPVVESLFSSPQMIRQELRYIPNTVHAGFEGNGQRSRGFGLVYFAEINILTGRAFIYLPMKFIFRDDINGYELFIDPIDDSRFTPGESVARSVYVKGQFITGTLEATIRDRVDTAISNLDPPVFVAGVDNSEFMLTGFNTASGMVPPLSATFRPPANFDCILIPDDEADGLKSTILWERIGNGDITNREQVQLVFLE